MEEKRVLGVKGFIGWLWLCRVGRAVNLIG
jgi:hypothetical protein